jgi:hypothetical protein
LISQSRGLGDVYKRQHNVIGKDRVHLMDKVLNYIIEKNHP